MDGYLLPSGVPGTFFCATHTQGFASDSSELLASVSTECNCLDPQESDGCPAHPAHIPRTAN
eukprot:529800-Amphidinium_carterae.1